MPIGICHGAGRFAVLRHPRAVQMLDAHRLMFTDESRAELVERVQPLIRSVAWALPSEAVRGAVVGALMMVTLLATAGRGRLQAMGVPPTLVSRTFPPPSRKALDR